MGKVTHVEIADDKGLQPAQDCPPMPVVKPAAIAITPAEPLDTMLVMINSVINSEKFDIAAMKELIRMRNDERAAQAKQVFDESYSKLEAEIPSIIKSGVVDFRSKNGRTNYTHATLEDIVSQIKPALCKYGFSISHIKTHRNEKVTVETTLRHASGHEITTTDSAPADITGNKNNMQARMSTATYLKRSNICDLLNIATKDADDDGKAGGNHFITPEQVGLINKLLDDTEADKVKFVRDYMKVKSINEILAGDYNKAINALEIKRKAVQSNENTH